MACTVPMGLLLASHWTIGRCGEVERGAVHQLHAGKRNGTLCNGLQQWGPKVMERCSIEADVAVGPRCDERGCR